MESLRVLLFHCARFLRVACAAVVLAMTVAGAVSSSGLAQSASAGNSLARLSGTTQYSIDYIDDGVPINLAREHPALVTVVAGQPLLVGGWAVDVRANSSAGGVTVLVDGRQQIRATYGIKRPDVARVLHRSRWSASGFAATVKTGGLSAGSHVLSFRVIATSGRGYYQLPARIGFVVVGSAHPVGLRLVGITRGLSVDALYGYGQKPVVLSRSSAPVRVQRGSTLVAVGWAVDPRTHNLARGVIVTVDGRESLWTSYGLPRTDVARYYRVSAYARSGFSALIPTGYLSPGRHSLSVQVVVAAGRAYYAARAAIPFVVTR